MDQWVDAQREQATEVKILKIGRGGLHDDLKLIVVLQTIGIFAISAVSGAAARLNVGRVPVFGAECAQEGRWMKSAGAHFHVKRLQHYAAVVGPVFLQPQNNVLKCCRRHEVQPKVDESS